MSEHVHCPRCGAEVVTVRLVETHYKSEQENPPDGPSKAVPVTVTVDVACDAEPQALALADNRVVWAEIIGHDVPRGRLLDAGSLHKVHVCPTPA